MENNLGWDVPNNFIKMQKMYRLFTYDVSKVFNTVPNIAQNFNEVLSQSVQFNPFTEQLANIQQNF